ncbi:MAG: YkgJ family cysteine cluster protein [Oligoflexus sp.]|nr:YkgJ family cysteine cluster protein [Oligoflexus sp.]
MPLSASSGRSCSTCNYCCIYLEIESKPGYSTRFDNGEDIAKPANQACAFLGEQGCTIYGVRPLVCRQFRCDWLNGVKGFGPEDSPIQSGVLGVRGSNWIISVGASIPLMEPDPDVDPEPKSA